MKINLSLAKEAILHKNGLNHLQVELIPPKRKQKQTKPNLMVFVLDRSGSMAGGLSNSYLSVPDARCNEGENTSKMQQAISAVTKFLSLITPEDLVGVVSFDDIAVVDQPLVHIDDSNRHQVVANLRQIMPRGCTNISDALEEAAQLITADHLKEYNCKIILLSDGQANRGFTTRDELGTLSLQCLQKGITVSSLGVGYRYDSDIMGSIANSGGGLFYHLEDLSLLKDIFEEELQLSNAITAKQVRVVLELPALVEVGENLNQYAQKVVNDNIEITIGDLYGPRKILFEIRNNFCKDDFSFTAHLLYKTLNGRNRKKTATVSCKVVQSESELQKAKENKAVVDLVLSLVKDQAIAAASTSYERNDMSTIQSAFTHAHQNIRAMNTTYATCDSQQVMEDMMSVDNAYHSGTVDVSYAKRMYALSNRRQREN